MYVLFVFISLPSVSLFLIHHFVNRLLQRSAYFSISLRNTDSDSHHCRGVLVEGLPFARVVSSRKMRTGWTEMTEMSVDSCTRVLISLIPSLVSQRTPSGGNGSPQEAEEADDNEGEGPEPSQLVVNPPLSRSGKIHFVW